MEFCPHPRQKQHIFFDPGSAFVTALLISSLTSAASFGASLLITKLLTPKPKPQVKGKLTGEFKVKSLSTRTGFSFSPLQPAALDAENAKSLITEIQETHKQIVDLKSKLSEFGIL